MKRNIVIAAVTAAALIGGGTATALATTADDEGPARQADTRPSDDDTGDRDDAPARASVTGVTAPQAIASALRHTAGTVVSAELDDEDDDRGRTAWEIDVLTPDSTWRSVTVDAGTGKVVDTHTENDEDEGTTAVRSALKDASVTAADAAKAVAGKGGEVTSVDLDEDGRSPAWEVESHGSDGHDWLVDLKTAKVTQDHDDD